MIVDNHAHIFPYLGGKSEYKSREVQLVYAQKLLNAHPEPTRRIDNYKPVEAIPLWDKDKPGPEGMRDVNFRVGKFGRYEWTVNGVDYFRQYMPVGLQDMISSPEFLIAQMNWVGIDKVVLQRCHIYGKLENYYHDAMQKFPGRFIGLTQVDESRAYCEDQISELHRAINELKLNGLFFESGGIFVNGFKYNFDDKIFDPFWKEVNLLSIPVYAGFDGVDFLNELRRWEGVLEKYSDITLVISESLPEEIALRHDKPYIPEVVSRLVMGHKVFLDLVYPIAMGRKYEYPFLKAQHIIRHLLDTFGPKKLLWGSDMPNVERYCTYAQSLNYLKNYCSFLSDSDKELILGKNVMEIFGLNSQ